MTGLAFGWRGRLGTRVHLDLGPARKPETPAVLLTVGDTVLQLDAQDACSLADALRRLAAMSKEGWSAPEPEPVITADQARAFHLAPGGVLAAPRPPSPADLARRRA